MNSEQLYERCCEAARCLLAALELRDRSLIEHQIGVIRSHLGDPAFTNASHTAGQELLRREQLDALDAIVSQVESCLAQVREAEARHFNRMLRAQGLLEHLSRRWDSIPTSLLPVC